MTRHKCLDKVTLATFCKKRKKKERERDRERKKERYFFLHGKYRDGKLLKRVDNHYNTRKENRGKNRVIYTFLHNYEINLRSISIRILNKKEEKSFIYTMKR